MFSLIENFEKHKAFFLAYAQSFMHELQEPCFVLKREHTLRVVENTQKILSALNLSEEDHYTALLIALYHDIGRFLQYEKYRTFLDKKSENHAFIAVRVLKKQPVFLSEPKDIQKKVLAAIILHNTLKLPEHLPEKYAALCQIIRDADKLDIIYLMALNFSQNLPEKDTVLLHVMDEPEKYTEAILEQALNKEVISYTDLQYANDFKILLCSWIFVLYFAVSKKILMEQGNIFEIIYSLPKDKKIENFQNILKKILTNS